MRAELGLPSVRGDDEKGGGMMGGFGGSMGGVGAGKGKRPINVKFEIPYFTTSGIQVRYLKIIEPKVSKSTELVPLANANKFLAAISIPAVGAVHYTVWRHCGAITRRELVLTWTVINDMYTNDIMQRALLYYLHLKVQGAKALQIRTSHLRLQGKLSLILPVQHPALHPLLEYLIQIWQQCPLPMTPPSNSPSYPSS